jgi:hypothetical protein
MERDGSEAGSQWPSSRSHNRDGFADERLGGEPHSLSIAQHVALCRPL